MIFILLAGALIGLGLTLMIRELLPARPSLDAALQRLNATAIPAGVVLPGTDWRSRAARRLASQIAGTAFDLRIPRQDLALMGRSVEQYLANKITMLVVGLAGPTILSFIIQASAQATVVIVLVFTGYLFVIPDISLRSQAKQARAEFRIGLVSYLELVGLASLAGKGPTEALEAPVQVAHGWVFARLGQALDPARRGTRDTWDELERLGNSIAVPELTDIAVISRRSSEQGARVLDSLRAKTTSLRAEQHAAALNTAKAATETMTVPTVLIVLGFMILLGYPAFVGIG